jgi:hypothetical protein
VKGKHAAMAARREAETAMAVAERLADKNAELRHRTRLVESDAAMVPALRARIRELEDLAERSSSPRIEQMRARMAEMEAEHTAERAALHAFIAEMAQNSGITLRAALLKASDFGLKFDAPLVNSRQWRRYVSSKPDAVAEIARDVFTSTGQIATATSDR